MLLTKYLYLFIYIHNEDGTFQNSDGNETRGATKDGGFSSSVGVLKKDLACNQQLLRVKVPRNILSGKYSGFQARS